MLRFLIALGVLSGSLALAKENRVYVEAVEPPKVCDRFFDGPEKDRCVKTLNRPTADAYLTAVCDRQEDDAAFFDCIDLADKFHFDPRKIQNCSSDMEDKDRVSCLQTAGRPWKISKPEREPASRAKSTKKRLHKPSIKKHKAKSKRTKSSH